MKTPLDPRAWTQTTGGGREYSLFEKIKLGLVNGGYDPAMLTPEQRMELRMDKLEKRIDQITAADDTRKE